MPSSFFSALELDISKHAHLFSRMILASALEVSFWKVKASGFVGA
jgi:hypothetical protein